MSQPSPPRVPQRRQRFGPGLLVAAAFIGPGTVTTASLAGAQFGLGLLWALALSLIATITLQEMALRIGLVSRKSLAEALRDAIPYPVARWAVLGLVVVAIAGGNAAYEGGNLIGAVVGAGTLLSLDRETLLLATTALATLLLASGRYRIVERVLGALVALMALVFIGTALLAAPHLDWTALAQPEPRSANSASYALMAIALIGTTVVPYNLFLHASAVQNHWPAEDLLDLSLTQARNDTFWSVGLGGVATLAIMTTATVAFFGAGSAPTLATLADQLTPTLGAAAKPVFGLGLLAAGFTSAVTAPLAAAWALCGALGWPTNIRGRGFRLIWLTVLFSGAAVAVLDIKPMEAIIAAQAANGLLLPVIAALLLWLSNQRRVLGATRNGLLSNLLGLMVTVLVTGLGGYKLWTLWP